MNIFLGHLFFHVEVSKDVDEEGLPKENTEDRIGVKKVVESVREFLEDLKKNYQGKDTGRIDIQSTNMTAKIAAMERTIRELEATVKEQNVEKETKWSLMEMANSERVKTKEMEAKVARLIELEERIAPLEKAKKT